MYGPRPSRRVTAVLAIGFVLFASGASAYTLYRCRADGQTRTACCCPAKPASEQTDVRVESSCCDVSSVSVTRADGVERTRSELAAVDVAIVTNAASLVEPPPLPAPPWTEHVHTAVGPPILLQKRSFLL